MVETQICVKYCNNSIERANNLCILNNLKANITREQQQALVEDFKREISKGNITLENSTVKDKGATYSFTTTENQKNSENSNVSTINLGDCEYKLRAFYSIPDEIPLLIFKIDVYEEGLQVPKIEYEVYNPQNHEKLSLNVCQNSKVDLSIPISLDTNNLDKYNSSSGFYNDICYTYTSDKGTDLSLDDRKKEFIEKNLTVCEENCEFSGYNSETQKAICSCQIKIKLPLMQEISLDRKKLYDSFTNLKNILNLKVMKCYDVFLSKKGLTNNIGFYIVLPIIIFHIATIFIFYKKDYNIIIYKIKELLYVKKNYKKIEKIQIEKSEKK